MPSLQPLSDGRKAMRLHERKMFEDLNRKKKEEQDRA